MGEAKVTPTLVSELRKAFEEEPKKISCTVPVETLKDLLLKEYNSKKNFSGLLLKQDPEQKTLEDLEEEKPEPSKKENLPTTNISEILFKDNNILPPISSEYPQGINDRFKLEKPKIVDPLESILVQIKINHTKINFLMAQNYLIARYIQTALETLDPDTPKEAGDPFSAKESKTKDIKNEFLRMYNQFNVETMKKLREENEDPIHDLIDTLPCSIHELKFLISILKQYEGRRM
jgi:hypothetical protein